MTKTGIQPSRLDTTRATPTASNEKDARALAYRPYLDGLRTIAVYLVIAFHAGLPGFAGGYVGVDVFFVLSGFLVTKILLRDLVAFGRPANAKFYARRVRRILPLSLLALLVIALVYATVATPAEMLSVVGGFRAACLYAANWHFIRQSTNYFAPSVTASPVLHFWSLAVEEQFYLAWPVVLGGLYFVFRSRRWRWNAMRVFVLAGGVVSAIAAWRIAGVNLNRAYYGTDTRSYQLLAGALLALSPQFFRFAARNPRLARVSGAVAIAGIVIVASSALHSSPITRGFAVTAFAAVAIVAFDEPTRGRVKRLLASDPFTSLGRISYGTYVWHWPIIVIVLHDHRVASVPLFALTCVVATALAALSYRLLEQPIRNSRRLNAFQRPVVAVGVAASLVAGLVLMPLILDNQRNTSVHDSKGATVDWRAARTDFENLPDCLHTSLEHCIVVHGTGQRVLLVGDSYAQMWMPALEQIAKSQSLTLAVAALDACPWQRGLFYIGQGSFFTQCKQHQNDWYDRVVPAFRPNVVVLAQAGLGSSQFQLPLTFPDGRKLSSGDPAYAQAFIQASGNSIAALRGQNRKIVIIEPTPGTFPFDPISCLSSGRPLAKCAHTVDATPSPLVGYYRSLGSHGDISPLDLSRVVCPRFPVCDAVVHGMIVRRDANGHLTATFARSTASTLLVMLAKAGVLAPR